MAFVFKIVNSGEIWMRMEAQVHKALEFCYHSSMSTVELLERALDPFTECLTPEAARRIIALRADPETQSRIDQLADRANDGSLTDDERADYEKLRAAFHVITILQSRARRLLKGQSTS